MAPIVQMVAITRPDGGVTIHQIVLDDGHGIVSAGTDAEIIASITKAGVPTVKWRRITIADLPADRTDRNAWTDSGTAITVNATRKAALLDAMRNAEVDGLQIAAPLAFATALLTVINDVRRLNSQPALTAAQYKAYLKSLLA